MMNRMASVCAALCAVSLAFSSTAETITVSDTVLARLQATTNRVESSTLAQGAAYPVSVTAPSFWIDCSDTTGWTMAAGSTVAEIPSKTGSTLAGSRYLTTDLTDSGWGGWPAGGIANKPYLRTSADLMDGEGKYLDFRPNSWRCGLVFNSVDIGGGTLSSVFKCGTVISVRTSDLAPDANGTRYGGQLLGGSPTYMVGWIRGGNPVTSDEWTGAVRWNNSLAGNSAQASVKNGRVYLDGQLCAPGSSSFNGHWQIVSLQCADANAETLGLGIDALNNHDNAGGELIAEMLIYDTVLLRSEIEKIEMYLEQKWFGRNRAGWNGDAKLGVAVAFMEDFKGEIAVPEGETLELSRVQGGAHAGAELVKTGDGKLVLSGEGVANYTGDLKLDGGTLGLPALKPVPALGDLADHLYARFDATEAGALETETVDGRTYVNVWSNSVTTASALAFNKPFMLRPYKAAKRPWILADALGDGLDVVDFGWFVNQALDSVHMVFSIADAGAEQNNPKILHNIQTVVVLMGAQGGGGHLFSGSSFQRGTRNASARTYPLFDSARTVGQFNSYGPDIKGGEQKVWINGRIWDQAKGYESSGYQVVAFQTAGAAVGRLLMEGDGGYSGGARIGEILLWNRTLTEEEIRDAQAYLSAKWLKKATPGYVMANGSGAVADIQKLSVPAGATAMIDVAAGRTVRVDTLAVQGTLVKTGAGELDVREASTSDGGKVSLSAGAVEMAAVRDVVDVNSYAAGASLHVDATDTNTLSLAMRGSDGAQVVVNWADKENRVNLRNSGTTSDTSRTPHINPADLNGKYTVDVGYWGDASAMLGTHGGTWMFLDRPLHSMRAIYAVVKYHGYQGSTPGQKRLGFLFSNQTGTAGVGQIGESDTIDFHPCTTGGQWDGRFLVDYQGYFAGNCFTNGFNTTTAQFVMPVGEYVLVELHPTAGVSGGVMGMDRTDTSRIGGFAIGELIVYEHPLSEREKVATRNYLLKKWFPDKALSEMPEAPAVNTFGGDFSYAAGATWNVAVKSDGTTDDLRAVAGTLSFGAGSTINLTGLGALGDLHGRQIVIACAGAFAGVDNLVVTGDVAFTDATAPTFRATSQGALIVRFGKHGITLLIK